MTVHELLHGEPAPLSGPEFNYWISYYKLRAEEEEKANKKGSKGKTGENQRPKTMGTN